MKAAVWKMCGTNQVTLNDKFGFRCKTKYLKTVVELQNLYFGQSH